MLQISARLNYLLITPYEDNLSVGVTIGNKCDVPENTAKIPPVSVLNRRSIYIAYTGRVCSESSSE